MLGVCKRLGSVRKKWKNAQHDPPTIPMPITMRMIDIQMMTRPIVMTAIPQIILSPKAVHALIGILHDCCLKPCAFVV